MWSFSKIAKKCYITPPYCLVAAMRKENPVDHDGSKWHTLVPTSLMEKVAMTLRIGTTRTRFRTPTTPSADTPCKLQDSVECSAKKLKQEYENYCDKLLILVWKEKDSSRIMSKLHILVGKIKLWAKLCQNWLSWIERESFEQSCVKIDYPEL